MIPWWEQLSSIFPTILSNLFMGRRKCEFIRRNIRARRNIEHPDNSSGVVENLFQDKDSGQVEAHPAPKGANYPIGLWIHQNRRGWQSPDMTSVLQRKITTSGISDSSRHIPSLENNILEGALNTGCFSCNSFTSSGDFLYRSPSIWPGIAAWEEIFKVGPYLSAKAKIPLSPKAAYGFYIET